MLPDHLTTSRTDLNVENMTEVARNDYQFSALQIEPSRNKETVRLILTKDLNMKKCVTKWY